MKAGILLGSYCLYVIVCANFNKWFGPTETAEENNNYIRYEAFEVCMPISDHSEVSVAEISSHV